MVGHQGIPSTCDEHCLPEILRVCVGKSRVEIHRLTQRQSGRSTVLPYTHTFTFHVWKHQHSDTFPPALSAGISSVPQLALNHAKQNLRRFPEESCCCSGVAAAPVTN